MSSHVKSDAFCLVPLHDKVSVVESCIMLLEDTEKALQAKREDINFLMSELSDIEVKTSRLITHLRLNIISLKKELPPETPTTPTAPVAPWRANGGTAKGW
ncbi:hypothetical protein H634G_11319 [Metarhizium anisopliae BRIP 53293]|uniref:Uncharacterized protein n=1 Tax=Metarhizium anisopliae BRIP 53293 TaxID=1291518 RepID=A0A0D9NHJ5_METAN|nr:hypothetical protein H634G_11319 [Metarhizium anisopliae BRIP 53293]KJK84850.1 hypothetical protein H633G_11348 [Metarhizium anisopliae BRIP 53284]